MREETRQVPESLSLLPKKIYPGSSWGGHTQTKWPVHRVEISELQTEGGQSS